MQNKIAIIPDMHENMLLLQQATTAHEDGYKLIFLGDYVDAFEREIPASHYLLKVIKLIKENESIALLGNHDMQYIYPDNGLCSGYQPKMAAILRILFEENLHLFKITHILNQFIFSHAGFSEMFVQLVQERYSINTVEEFIEIMNSMPREIHFCGKDNDGPDGLDGPLWLRPKRYRKFDFLSNYKQIVGHTHSPEPFQKDNLITIDCGNIVYLNNLLC